MRDIGRAADGLPNHHAQIGLSGLLFRCWHRGTQEIDLILGSFAESSFACFDNTRLDRSEALLDCADPDLCDAIVRRHTT